MTSDSKKFENAVASGKPFVCSSTFRGDGTVRHIILFDDKYWRVNEIQHDQIMLEGIHPEELELTGFTDNNLEDDDHE